MADDLFKPSGPVRRSSDLFHSANPVLTARIGIVKSNVDVMRSNSLEVYLVGNTGLNPDDNKNWITVFFLSPFYGATQSNAPNDTAGSYVDNPTSYGMWHSPPDIGTEVLCLFAQGDMNYGFYIGCLPDPTKLHMVPAIGASTKVRLNTAEAASYGGATKLPVTNINTNNNAISNSPDFLDAAKPVHSYAAHIMFQQGILRDPIRGPISSNAQRETPSRVGWGVSTPGRPVLKGGFTDDELADNLKPEKSAELALYTRRLGHSIVMDDGDIAGNDRLIRIRTAQGHQILMSDDGQTLMILHSNGQSYVELGKEGTVDVYSTNSINLRTQGDLNLHADNNINIHAGKNLNLQGDNIKINSDQDLQQRAGNDHKILTTGMFTHKIGGVYAVKSGDEASLASASTTFINGSRINLNTGSPGTKPGDVSPIDKALHTDTLFDSEKGFIAAPAKLISITSRAPAHAPWADAGQGVDVKVELSAEAALPVAPSDAVQSINDAADQALSGGVAAGAVASAPQLQQVSDAIDTKTTQALAAAAASDSRTGPLAAATTSNDGTAVVDTPDGKKAVAGGTIPMTADQMQQAGILKPGSAALVNSLAASTGNTQVAFSPAVFASSSLTNFATNPVNQATALSTNLQTAQTKLQNAGVLTGGETPTQVAGLAYAAANQGVPAVTDALKLYAASQTAPATAAAAGATAAAGAASAVLKDIGKGNFAAGIATGLKSSLSGMQASLFALRDKFAASVLRAKGAAAGLFAAIKKGLKPFKPKVPQDLEEIAKQNADSVSASSLSAVTNAASQAASTATGVNLDVSSVSSAAAVASGLTTLPGGASAVNAVNTGTTPNLPGTSNLKNLMQNASTSAMNNLSKTANNALNAATSALADQLKSSPMMAVLTKLLPAGAAAQLLNTLTSLTPPSSGLKIPTVSTDTVNRKSVDATAKGQLGDSKIPPPVWSAPQTETWAGVLAKRKEYDKLVAAYAELDKKSTELVQKEKALFAEQIHMPYEARNPDNPDYAAYMSLQEQRIAISKEKKDIQKQKIDARVAAETYYAKTYFAQQSYENAQNNPSTPS